MPRPQQPQHRPSREDRVKSQELADLKRQNRILTRTVSRLEKENMKLRAMPDPEPVPEPDSVDTPFPFSRCEECQSQNVRDVKLPIGIMRFCNACGSRKKVAPKT